MAIIPAKCTQCGANIQVDDTKEAGICESCGTAFITEKVVNNYNTINNYHAEVVNIYEKNDDFECSGHTLLSYKGTSSVVDIPTHITVIGQSAFSGNTAIKKIIMSDSIREIQHKAFQNCTSLEEIVFSKNLYYIGKNSFANCKQIKQFIFPDSVSIIDEFAFYHCENITKVKLPPLITVVKVHTFDGCENLSEVILPQGLKTLESEIFWKCTSLKTITIPASVTTLKDFVFAWSHFTDIYFENADNITSVNSALFLTCEKVPNIHASEGFKQKFGKFFSTNDEELNKSIKEYNSNNSNGCYVATCVYGSYDCPQVWTLRRYRDNTLASTWYGKVFIYTYYAISPTIVKWFGNTQWFKNLCKNKLDKMVSNLRSNGVEDTPYQDKDWR